MRVWAEYPSGNRPPKKPHPSMRVWVQFLGFSKNICVCEFRLEFLIEALSETYNI